MGPVLIFHAGALGDFVLSWPLLRALKRSGRDVIAAASDGHGLLARRCLGIRNISTERREVTALWRPGETTAGRDQWRALLDGREPEAVITFLADDASAGGTTWLANARSAFAHAQVFIAGPPGSSSRAETWSRFAANELGGVSSLHNPRGPVVAHVGAGSVSKRWAMHRWSGLVASLRHDGATVDVIAGEVEQEQFDAQEMALFQGLRGRFLAGLGPLCDVLEQASAFIGADSGPTHLAAQLGLPTLALFGPTDPSLWSPVGPQVRVLSPQLPSPMHWLEPDSVRLSLNELLAADRPGAPRSN